MYTRVTNTYAIKRPPTAFICSFFSSTQSSKMVKGQKSTVSDLVTRDYTINLHKRLHGVQTAS